MRIRMMQLINNYYSDDWEKMHTQKEALGEWCIIGYFDAFHQEVIDWNPENCNKGIKELADDIVVDKTDGKSNRSTLICLTREQERDDRFWKYAEEMPYISISLLRIAQQADSEKKMLLQVLQKFDREEDTMIYYTYDHADLIIVKAARRHKEIMEFVDFVKAEIKIYKMYTAFAIRERVLQICKESPSCKVVEDEVIDCRLRCAVKNEARAKKFARQLMDKMKACNSEYQQESFHILGGKDMLIEMKNVHIHTLLPLYLTGEMCTHMCPQYYHAFFNIESEFLVKGGIENGTGL